MKYVMITLLLALSINAQAHIDDSAGINVEASAVEVSNSRACFSELATNGCRHPSEDPDQFRTCLGDSFHALTEPCQVMMKRLYGKK